MLYIATKHLATYRDVFADRPTSEIVLRIHSTATAALIRPRLKSVKLQNQ